MAWRREIEKIEENMQAKIDRACNNRRYEAESEMYRGKTCRAGYPRNIDAPTYDMGSFNESHIPTGRYTSDEASRLQQSMDEFQDTFKQLKRRNFQLEREVPELELAVKRAETEKSMLTEECKLNEAMKEEHKALKKKMKLVETKYNHLQHASNADEDKYCKQSSEQERDLQQIQREKQTLVLSLESTKVEAKLKYDQLNRKYNDYKQETEIKIDKFQNVHEVEMLSTKHHYEQLLNKLEQDILVLQKHETGLMYREHARSTNKFRDGLIGKIDGIKLSKLGITEAVNNLYIYNERLKTENKELIADLAGFKERTIDFFHLREKYLQRIQENLKLEKLAKEIKALHFENAELKRQKQDGEANKAPGMRSILTSVSVTNNNESFAIVVSEKNGQIEILKVENEMLCKRLKKAGKVNATLEEQKFIMKEKVKYYKKFQVKARGYEKELAQKSHEISDLEKQLGHVKSKYKKNSNQLQHQLDTHTGKIFQLQQVITAREKHIRQLRKNLETLKVQRKENNNNASLELTEDEERLMLSSETTTTSDGSMGILYLNTSLVTTLDEADSEQTNSPVDIQDIRLDDRTVIQEKITTASHQVCIQGKCNHVEELQHKIQQLKEQVKMLGQELKVEKNIKKKLQEEVDGCKKEISNRKNLLAGQETIKKMLTNTNHQCCGKRGENTTKDNTQLEREKEEHHKTVMNMNSKIQSLQQELNYAKENYEKLKNTNEVKGNDQCSLNQVASKEIEVKNEILKFKEQHQREEKVKDEKIANLSNQLNDIEEKYNNLIKDSHEEIRMWQEKCKKTKNEIEELENKKKMESNVKQLDEGMPSNLQKEETVDIQDFFKIKEEHEQIENDEKIVNLTNDLNDARDKYEQLVQAHNTCETESRTWKEKFDRCQKEMKELEAQSKANTKSQENNINEWRAKFQNVSDELKAVEKELDLKEEKAVHYRQEIELLKEEKKGLLGAKISMHAWQDKCDGVSFELEIVEKELNVQKNKAANYEKEIKKLKEQKGSCKPIGAATKHRNEEILLWKEKLQSASKKIKELQKQIKSSKLNDDDDDSDINSDVEIDNEVESEIEQLVAERKENQLIISELKRINIEQLEEYKKSKEAERKCIEETKELKKKMHDMEDESCKNKQVIIQLVKENSPEERKRLEEAQCKALDELKVIKKVLQEEKEERKSIEDKNQMISDSMRLLETLLETEKQKAITAEQKQEEVTKKLNDITQKLQSEEKQQNLLASDVKALTEKLKATTDKDRKEGTEDSLLKSEFEALKKELAQNMKNKNELQQTVKSTEEEIQSLYSERESLKNEHDNILYKLKIKLSNLEDDKEMLKSKQKKSEENCENKDSEISVLKKRIEYLNKQTTEGDNSLLEEKGKHLESKKKIIDLNAKIEQLTAENGERDEIIKELQNMASSNRESEDRIRQLEDDLIAMKNTVEDLKSIKVELENLLEKETHTLRKKIKEGEGHIRNLVNDLDAANKEKEDLHACVKNLESTNTNVVLQDSPSPAYSKQNRIEQQNHDENMASDDEIEGVSDMLNHLSLSALDFQRTSDEEADELWPYDKDGNLKCSHPLFDDYERTTSDEEADRAWPYDKKGRLKNSNQNYSDSKQSSSEGEKDDQCSDIYSGNKLSAAETKETFHQPTSITLNKYGTNRCSSASSPHFQQKQPHQNKQNEAKHVNTPFVPTLDMLHNYVNKSEAEKNDHDEPQAHEMQPNRSQGKNKSMAQAPLKPLQSPLKPSAALKPLAPLTSPSIQPSQSFSTILSPAAPRLPPGGRLAPLEPLSMLTTPCQRKGSLQPLSTIGQKKKSKKKKGGSKLPSLS